MAWFELLCFGSPTVQLAYHRVWFCAMWPDRAKGLFRSKQNCCLVKFSRRNITWLIFECAYYRRDVCIWALVGAGRGSENDGVFKRSWTILHNYFNVFTVFVMFGRVCTTHPFRYPFILVHWLFFLKGFNTELEELHQIQKTYAVPDTQLRDQLRNENIDLIVPHYTTFREK